IRDRNVTGVQTCALPIFRKMIIDPVRIQATFADFFSVISLIIVSGIGTYMTLVYNLNVEAYEYRGTIGPWFRSLFTFQPKYELKIGRASCRERVYISDVV